MGDAIELQATGSFGGAAQELRLWTEGDRLCAWTGEMHVVERYEWLDPLPPAG